MRILFLTKGDENTGSSRQRVWFLAEKLRAAFGIEYEVLCKLKKFSNLARFWREVKRGDTLFVHKSLFPWDIVLSVLAAKLFLKKKLIYDLDDAEWSHSPMKTELFMRHADAVFAGSHAILEHAMKFNKNSILIPTVVDHEVYAKYKVNHILRDTITIGWVGVGRAHFLDGHFEPIKKALIGVGKALIGVGLQSRVRLVVIGSQGHEPLKEYFKKAPFETIFVDKLDWTNPESVPAAIRQYEFDIGLMPNSDTPFNRAKCAFKAIEYLACGVPVVASDVGEARYVVEDGATGFLVDDFVRSPTSNSWAGKIAVLARDPELRQKMGERGMEKIKGEYSYDAILQKVKAVL